jgi:hypothetical protein
MRATQRKFGSFAEFYPYYLSEHTHPTCRRLHVVGTAGVLVVLGIALASSDARWLLAVPMLGYGLAWIGHFFYEGNRPATFDHPLYSLLGDFAMFRDVLTGRIAF